jgi:hypothetical protein
MSRQSYLVVGAACALALSAVSLNRGGGRRGAGEGRPRVAGAHATWLHGGRPVPAYRVVLDGEAVRDNGAGSGGAPPVRVDLEVDGRPVTLWFRDPQAAPRAE